MICRAKIFRFKKLFLVLLFLFGCMGVDAQVISGRVLSDTSNQPVTATITTAFHQTSSNANGVFTIQVFGKADTISVYAMGYKTYLYPLTQWQRGDITIRLKPRSLMLKNVEIRAQRDHTLDSIKNRREFEQVFKYQPPKLKDMLTSSPPQSNVPFAFVNINVTLLISILTKNSDPTYKLKKELIRDEQADYISTRFNRPLVTRLTHLKGDSLDKFMDKYYPTIDWVKKTNDYDMIQYIRYKLIEFKKHP